MAPTRATVAVPAARGRWGWGRLLAAVHDPVSAVGDRWFLAPHRRALVAGLEGRVLDLGAGTGRSFPYLATVGGLEVHAVEPDPHMRRRAVARAAALDLDVTVHAALAEALPFADGAFDAAISSLVLCTVGDPDGARAELARVVRPGGEVRLLEHVRGEGLRGRLQRALAPAWCHLAGGCDLTRRQHEPYLADPAFEVLALERLAVGVFPIRPLVAVRLGRR